MTLLSLPQFKLKKKDRDLLVSIIYYSLLTSLFFNVFPHVNFIKDFFFYLSLLLFFGLAYLTATETPRLFFLKTPFLLFTTWAFVMSIFAQEVQHSFSSFYSHLIRYLFLYYLLINVFKEKKDLVYMSWVLVASSFLFFAGGVSYFYIIIDNPISKRFGFSSFSINIICFFTIFSTLLSLRLLRMQRLKLKKLILVFGIIFFIAVTLLTQSRGGFISLGLSLSIMLIRSRRLLIFFMGVLLLLLFLFPVQNRFLLEKFSDKPRMHLLYYSMEIIKENPIAGVGFAIDTFKNKNLINQERFIEKIPEEYRKYRKGFRLPHSWPLSILVRTGIIGFGLYCFVLISLYTMSVKLMFYGRDVCIKEWGICLTASLTMYLFSGLFEPIFIHSLDTIFYTICAMIVILWNINNKNEPLPS